MTNAEKYNLNKDEFIAKARATAICDDCIALGYCLYHQEEGSLCAERAEEWLESEAEEDTWYI